MAVVTVEGVPRRRIVPEPAPQLELEPTELGAETPTTPSPVKSSGSPPGAPSTPGGLATVLAASSAVSSVYSSLPDEWADSPFKWLKDLPPATRGAASGEIVELVLRGLGFDVAPRRGPGHDRVVAGRPVAVRFSTLWSHGVYTFQRLDRIEAEVVVLLGVSPQRCHIWVLETSELAVVSGEWLTVDPSSPPAWLALHGGDPDLLLARASSVFGAPGPPHGPAAVHAPDTGL